VSLRTTSQMFIAEVTEVVPRREQNEAELSGVNAERPRFASSGGPEARRGARISGTGPRVFRR